MPYGFLGSSIKFQGHTGWKIDKFNPIWVRLLGRSQLSNPSDLPCFFFFNFSVATVAPLLEYTCYMWYRQETHKSHRISNSLCPHDNALLNFYWYLYFMLIWPWCILYYVWWAAIKLFQIWVWIWIGWPTFEIEISNPNLETGQGNVLRNISDRTATRTIYLNNDWI